MNTNAGTVDAVLIVAAHGTASPLGLATLRSIIAAVRSERPELSVLESFLDVAEPTFADVIAAVDQPGVVVPVLLSGGYHVRTDIPSLVAGRAHIAVARPLGPDRALSAALAARLAEARGDRRAGDAVVMVAAGSSDPSARADVTHAAADLADLLGADVFLAVMSGPGRRLADVRADYPYARLDVASYLLAEGGFDSAMRRQASELGIETVAAPLGAHPAIVDLILARYDAGLGPHATGDL